MKKRERNPVRTREKLLKATLDLVAEKGVEGLSMKEAAIRAKVSRSVAYLHFDDRDHLLSEAKEWISEQLQHGVKKFEDDATLYDRILHTTELVMRNPEAAKVMLIDAIAGGDLDLHDPLVQSVSGRLKRLKKEGRVDSGTNVEISTFIHIGSIAATLLYQEQHKDTNVKTLARRFAKQWSEVLEQGMIHPDQ